MSKMSQGDFCRGGLWISRISVASCPSCYSKDWPFVFAYKHPLVTYLLRYPFSARQSWGILSWNTIKNQSKTDYLIQLPGWRNGIRWDGYLEQEKVLSSPCSLSLPQHLWFLPLRDTRSWCRMWTKALNTGLKFFAKSCKSYCGENWLLSWEKQQYFWKKVSFLMR